LPDTTPAAAIHAGSTSQQRKVIATLADLASAVARAGLRSPVTTIVGSVVALSDQLDWFKGESRQYQEVDDDDTFRLARA
jgi:uroporphyrin-III C-methyltransferase